MGAFASSSAAEGRQRAKILGHELQQSCGCQPLKEGDSFSQEEIGAMHVLSLQPTLLAFAASKDLFEERLDCLINAKDKDIAQMASPQKQTFFDTLLASRCFWMFVIFLLAFFYASSSDRSVES